MGITWYVARRLAWVIFAAWFAMTVTFLLISLSPSAGQLTAAVSAAQGGGDANEAIEDYKKARGLDKPLHERYIDFATGILTLNWGWSQERSQFALDAIWKSIPYSLQYGLPVTAFTTVVGYGLGLWAALNRGKRQDAASTVIAFFGASIPNFWFAIIGILVLGVWFGDANLFGVSLAPLALPTFYDATVVDQHGFLSWQNYKQLLMPMAVLATSGLGFQMRYGRAQLVENFQKEFIKTARAKGRSELGVMLKHALRVALVPLTNVLVGTVLGALLGGSLIIEVVFGIPGVSQLFFRAAVQQDIPLILGPTLLFSGIAIFGNLIEDLLYTVLDPRVSWEDR